MDMVLLWRHIFLLVLHPFLYLCIQEKILCEVYISGGLWRRLVTKNGQRSRQCRLAVLEMLDDILTLRLT